MNHFHSARFIIDDIKPINEIQWENLLNFPNKFIRHGDEVNQQIPSNCY